MPKPDCAVCGHAEAFHGVSDRSKGALFDGVAYCRAGQVQDGPDSYMITCPCSHYEPMMEEHDGLDNSTHSRDSGLPVPAPGLGTLAETVEELRAVLDEPMVIYGGKTTREMLGGGNDA